MIWHCQASCLCDLSSTIWSVMMLDSYAYITASINPTRKDLRCVFKRRQRWSHSNRYSMLSSCALLFSFEQFQSICSLNNLIEHYHVKPGEHSSIILDVVFNNPNMFSCWWSWLVMTYVYECLQMLLDCKNMQNACMFTYLGQAFLFNCKCIKVPVHI